MSHPKKQRQKGPMDTYYTPNPHEFVKSRKGGRQQTINVERMSGIKFSVRLRDGFTMQILEHEQEWEEKGCSILSDGWRDSVVQKDIINFMVNSPKGSVFVKSFDVSDVSKDADLLFHVLDKMVEEVGEKNVVQVVTDNALAYVKAGKLLEAKREHLYWTPCAAHCLDLMLEDIGKKVPKFTKERNLHRQVVTTFATSFITLAQVHRQRHHLNTMLISTEWEKAKWSSKNQIAKKVKTYFMQDSFWRNVLYALKLTDPLVKVLRLVDGEKYRAMGYIYEAMDRVKEAIRDSFSNADDYKTAFQIIDQMWECQLHKLT
ncbi:unnamed protein product [Lactuca virosa]|uniref:DUF659 domain-containing protein n=1 Tax=Lactuca virosa TaxID=75947 RepID=A0AAU9LFP8_9ASTR|nr:unnamed protein product [Lactuca virosa]